MSNRVNQVTYLFTAIESILLLVILLLVRENTLFQNSIAFILMFTGFVIILLHIKYYSNVIRPQSIFAMIWLIALPATSFSYPIMDRMTDLQWNFSLVFILSFSIGGFISSLIGNKGSNSKLKNSLNKSEIKLNDLQYFFCLIIIITANAMIFLSFLKRGEFPALSENAGIAKFDFFIPGTSTIIILGILGIFVVFLDHRKRKNKTFIILTFIYVVLQFLTAVRFGLFLLILLLLSNYSKDKLKPAMTKRLLLFSFLLILFFIVIGNVRGGNIDKYLFFSGNGSYSGTENSLRNTEIIRYFGYSQRVMQKYIETFPAGYMKGNYTLSPILDLFQVPLLHKPGLSIYGYTATNIISYQYLDFGNLWPLAATIWSFLINQVFSIFVRTESNLLVSYAWGMSFICLTLSFYTYIQSYTFLFILFPLLIIMINLLGKISIKSRRGEEHDISNHSQL